MICATVLNSVRQKRSDRVWKPDDFVGSSAKRTEAELMIRPAEELLAMLEQYMPPPRVQ